MSLNHELKTNQADVMTDINLRDLRMARECARNIRKHLLKLVNSQPKYLSNLCSINLIITQYERALS